MESFMKLFILAFLLMHNFSNGVEEEKNEDSISDLLVIEIALYHVLSFNYTESFKSASYNRRLSICNEVNIHRRNNPAIGNLDIETEVVYGRIELPSLPKTVHEVSDLLRCTVKNQKREESYWVIHAPYFNCYYVLFRTSKQGEPELLGITSTLSWYHPKKEQNF